MRVAPMDGLDPPQNKGGSLSKPDSPNGNKDPGVIESQVGSPDRTKNQTQQPANEPRKRKNDISDSDDKPSPLINSAQNHQDGEDDSSNDDSSYFADPIHLPEPKSDKRFSFSSHGSGAQQKPSVPPVKSDGKESDNASLSLSDDSDRDEVLRDTGSSLGSFRPAPDSVIYNTNPQFAAPFGSHPGAIQYQVAVVRQAGNQQGILASRQFVPQTGAGVAELYPQQITRMHSVSSLVSTSSHNSTPSESSIRDELRDVAVDYGGQKNDVPSGRKSPVLGEHPPSRNQILFASPSTINPGPSPPTILQGSALPPGLYPHPQPHLMTQEQLAAWMLATNSLAGQPPVTARASGYSKESELAYSLESVSIPSNPINDAPTPTRKGSNRVSRKGTGAFRRDGKGIKQYSELNTDTLQRDNMGGGDGHHSSYRSEIGFKVYWQRWLMLFYMSLLNLLSDWTCYSVAPIALLTDEAFGAINAEQLVTVFLVANAFASACEPMILARLGLRRTVLFGALLLMIGSITKSGGMPPIIKSDLQKGKGEWRVYLGFFIVGLSQPLYQCTPALLSASWFPEAERTMATGVALNANQLGIGFAFIFGTLLVATSDDIPGYFGLLSILSTLAFLGTLIQFQDAPPTPPSSSAKVVRGTLEVNLPSLPAPVTTFFDSVRNIGQGYNNNQPDEKSRASDEQKNTYDSSSASGFQKVTSKSGSHQKPRRRRNTSSSKRERGDRRRLESPRLSGNKSRSENEDNGFHALAQGNPPTLAPSPAPWGPVGKKSMANYQPLGEAFPAPSPMMQGPVAVNANESDYDEDQEDQDGSGNQVLHTGFPQYFQPPYGYAYHVESGAVPYFAYQGYNPYSNPYLHPGFQQYAAYYQHQAYQHGYIASIPPADLYNYYYSYQHALPPPPHMRGYEDVEAFLPPSGLDEGAEPVLTITPHHLDIHIRDDQIMLSLKACMSRPGFIHSLVSFTVSGIVINTLSTFMDYLVRLNGVGREYTGIVGGSFQGVIMISSLIVGQLCDRTRAYYSITIGMLVLGAFGLAECGVSLDADRGTELRWALVIVAALVGPLQPVSTELGVDVVYPLSENTVLVIQQLFSNLLSAVFIPCFKAMRDIGRGTLVDGGTEKPQYTFSFYLLIVLHAICTVFFATFNGRYLRYEHEQDKLAEEERKKESKARGAFQPPELIRLEQDDTVPLLSLAV